MTRREAHAAILGALAAATAIWAWQAGMLGPTVMAAIVGVFIGSTWGDPPHGDDHYARTHPARGGRP